MIGIKEIVGYHEKTGGDSSSSTERFLWEDSPIMIKLSRTSKAMRLIFDQIPSKIVVIKEDKTEEYPREQCHGINGLYIDFSKPYWNNMTIIFDNGMTAEYNIPGDIETMSTDLTQYIESNYERAPVYNEWSQAAALLDDDMLDI